MRDRFVQILNERVPLAELDVTEFGCGDGVFTKELVKVSKFVHTSDGRSANVAKVMKLLLPGVANVGFSIFDVESADLHKDSTDVIFHVGLLYHLSDPEHHLKQIAGCARKAIFLDTHHSGGPAGFTRTESVGLPREGLRPTSIWLPLTLIVRTLETAGFVVEVLDDRRERNGPRATLLCTRK